MKRTPYRGFTLIELTVSIGIMALMSAVLLSSYPDSSVRINLVNLTQSIGLLVREAQIRGSAVDSNNGNEAGYGVYFNLASSSQVMLFADQTIPGNYINGILLGDGLYGRQPVDETSATTTLPDRYTITKLCVGTATGFHCNGTTTPAIDSLTISFIRPNPQPKFYINDSTSTVLTFVGSGFAVPTPYTGVCIEVSSPRAPTEGHVRSIRVQGAGFITTSSDLCK
jgi:prepilin-type N-terminal cleavage/methylation domain-containing protein